MDVERRLKEAIKDTGEVNSEYGGFAIKVLKPHLFPWYKVVKVLIEIGQEIWVDEKEGIIAITSEPKAR